MQLFVKNLLNPGSYPGKVHVVLLFLRIAVSILMLTHGMGKFEKLMAGGPIQFGDPLGIGAPASLALAVFSEILCSFLLIIGLGTRLATIPLVITMIIAAFIVHSADPFVKQELPLLYLAIYLSLMVTGAGRYSVDQIIYKK